MTGKRYAGQAVKAVPVGTRDFAGNMKRHEGETPNKNHPTAVEVIVYH
jgi:hypothetical protein